MPELVSLSIDNAPNKTTYFVGDRFERYGMVVKAHYSDGTSNTIDFYFINPSTPLSINDTQVTISFMDKSVTQSITVNNPPSTGYFIDKCLDKANYGNNPYVNTVDASISFYNSPITIERDSYTLNVILSYHSRMSDKESDLIKGFYKGFRTNYHQFLIKDGKDNDNNDIYKYIDGNGYIHTFLYNNETNLYHDKEGRYLILNITDRTITDSKDNVYTFDTSGRLISVKSGLNQLDIKIIEYNNDGIRKIYDNRNPNVYIKFSYNFSFLVYIRAYYHDDDNPLKTYTFNGLFGQTTSITETVGNNTRTLYEYLYNDREKVRRIVDHLNHVAYRLTYDFDTVLNDYRFNSIRQGYMSNDSLIEQKGIYYVRRNINTSDSYKPIYELVIHDDNNIDTSLMSDADGQLVSTFELDEDNENNYLSFLKEKGKYAGIDGECSDSINSAQAILVSDILRFNQGLSSTDLDSSQYIKLCGYIKIKREAQRIILYTYGSNFNSDNININPRALNIWQYFEVKIERVMNNNNPMPLSSFSVELIDNENYFVEAEFANLYFAKSEAKQRLFFQNNSANCLTYDDIQYIKISQSNGAYQSIENTYSPMFMSESDLLITLKRYYSSNDSPHIAYFNNGKTIISFYDDFYGVTLDNRAIYFLEENSCSNDTLGDTNNWFFATSETVSTKTYYRFKTNYYEIIVRNQITDSNNQIRYIDDISKYNYFDQLLENRKTYFDDSYNESTTTTTYQYFDDGQIKKIYQTNGNETIVLYEATYLNNNQTLRKTSGLQSVDVSYNNYLENIIIKNTVNGASIANSLYIKQILYDNYLQDVSSIAFKYNNESRGTNSVSQNGLTSTLSVNNNPLYQLTYNETNNTSTFKRYNGTSYENVVSIKQNDSIEELTYFGNSSNTIVTNNYDEYGRLINQKLNNEIKATFNYQSNWESPFIANLMSINDSYIFKVTSLSYNSIDSSVSQINFNNNEFAIIINNSIKEVRYCFANQSDIRIGVNGNCLSIYFGNSTNPFMEYTSVRDEFDRLNSIFKECASLNCLSKYEYQNNSNLISSFLFKNGSINSATTVYEEHYTYDELGNLTLIQYTYLINPYDSLYVSYQYDGFGRITYEENMQINVVREYSYDTYGRIIAFGSKHLSYNNKGQLEYFDNVQFTYDGYGNRVCKDNIEYEYERGHLLKRVKLNANEIISFTYDYLGRRYQKLINGNIASTYYYHDDKLIGEDRTGGVRIRYFYNESGITSFRYFYNNTFKDYEYIKNPFGQIMGIYDGTSVVARYDYDAWGNPYILYQSNGIADINPFRYRGYYYDQETELYYLLSRYYDPCVGQFISPDDFNYLGINNVSGFHLYEYCNNNPVMNVDPLGHSFTAVLLAVGIGALLGALGGTAGALMSDYRDNGVIDGSLDFRHYLGSIVGGAIGGAALGFAGGAGIAWLGPAIAGTGSAAAAWGGLLSSLLVSFAGGFLNYSSNKWISGDEWKLEHALIRGGLTSIEGLFAFGAGGVASLVSWEGGKTIKIFNSLINLPQFIAQNFVSDIFGNPTGWILDLIMETYFS